MRKKKAMALVLAGVLCTSALAGCGSSSDNSDSAASTGSKKQLTYILATRSEFQTSLSNAMIAEAEKHGYQITVQNGDNDAAKQLQYVETCHNAGDKAVMVQPVDADAAQSLIDAAGDMNIIFVNCPPTNMEVLRADNVAYVGSDENTSGYMQGEYLAEYFKSKGKKSISYIMLQGQLGYVATSKRTEGAIKALEDHGIEAKEASAPLVCDFDRPTAQENIAPILVSGATYDCIIANNDAMALGAVEACKAADIPIDFPIVGIDCTADGAQAIETGDMAMTVFQDPVGQGAGAFIAALNMIDGKPINTGMEQYKLDDSGTDYSDSIMWIPFETVTSDNVADYM